MVRFSFLLVLPALVFANDAVTVESVAITGADLHVNLETQVGQPYDEATVQRDVKYLWKMGRFDDVRAEVDGGAVRFIVAPKPVYRLHEVRMEPHSFGLQMKLAEGTALDDFKAHQIATEAEKQLRLQGYRDAQISYEFKPSVRRHESDLWLNIQAGDPVRVKHLDFDGDSKLTQKELMGALQALKTKPMIPGIWKLRPDYSQEAVDNDVSRIHSLYFSKGFFDAKVTADEPTFNGKEATLHIHLDPGKQFQVHGVDLKTLCPCMLAQRREAERQGILDFTSTLHVEREGASDIADASLQVDQGAPYRVRRIEFFGLHRYTDTTARRNMLLDEGDLLDQYRLRQSVGRLMDTHLFEDLQSKDIVIERDDTHHVADIKLRLTERKGGMWSFSGPVGPTGIGGGLRATIQSRLPGWGQGLFELSTYTVSLSLMAFEPPLIPGLITFKKFIPIISMTRGFLPGDSWRSGFAIVPQLGWQGSLFVTGTTQLQGRLLPHLMPNRGLIPELAVIVDGYASGTILCQAPKPKMAPLRMAGSILVRLPTAMTGL